MELVDIVDKDSNFLYTVSKDEAHQKGLLHKTVIAEVRDRQGRVILVKQASDRQDPGKYVSPVGGHVTSGETNDDALMRETEEEIGLSEIDYTFKGSFIFDRFVKAKNRQENHYFIVYEILCDGNLHLGNEAVSYKAFTTGELKQRIANKREDFGDSYLAILGKLYPELLEK